MHNKRLLKMDAQLSVSLWNYTGKKYVDVLTI